MCERERESEPENSLQGRERHIAGRTGTAENVTAKKMNNKRFLALLLFAAQIYGDCRIYTDSNDPLSNGQFKLARGTFA